jgi:hypothetical protein
MQHGARRAAAPCQCCDCMLSLHCNAPTACHTGLHSQHTAPKWHRRAAQTAPACASAGLARGAPLPSAQWRPPPCRPPRARHAAQSPRRAPPWPPCGPVAAARTCGEQRRRHHLVSCPCCCYGVSWLDCHSMPQQALSPAAAATSGPPCIAGPRKQSVQRGSRSAPRRLHLGQAARVLLLGCRQTLLQLAALAAGVLGQRPGGSGAGIVRQAAGAARQRNGMSSSQALRAATAMLGCMLLQSGLVGASMVQQQ